MLFLKFFFLSNNFHILQTSATNKLKMKVQYKHTTTYHWTLCPLKSNKAIKNMITIAKKPPWLVTICSNMGSYGCAAPNFRGAT